MKTALLCFLVATVYTASAVPINAEFSEHREYPRYIEFPDGEGVMHTVDLEAEPDLEILNEVTRNPANNQYLLFTRSESECEFYQPTAVIGQKAKSTRKLPTNNNNGKRKSGSSRPRRNPNSAQSLVMNNAASVHNSHFNPSVPTIVIVHGWLSNQNTDINPIIRAAYLAKNDVNVIVLDWRRLAISNYVTAAMGVPAVGRGLGQFLAFVNIITGAPFSSIHLVGFSLGAHLVGNAGRELGGRVARVTALDPAGPLWNLNSNRVKSTDGIFVEAIHTDGGYTVGGLGIGSDVADADFYVNGGISQPGCLTNICNHNRAWRYFAATVSYNHIIGNQCSNSWQITWNSCRGQELPMGNDDLRKFGTGRYRSNTNRRYPY